MYTLDQVKEFLGMYREYVLAMNFYQSELKKTRLLKEYNEKEFEKHYLNFQLTKSLFEYLNKEEKDIIGFRYFNLYKENKVRRMLGYSKTEYNKIENKALRKYQAVLNDIR